jgi:hypothetical protein
MKKTLTLLIAVILSSQLFAQAPNKMSYQAVIRNSSNNLVVSKGIGMQVSILQGSASGTAVYVERHFPNTNANGLATIEIGMGTIVSGSFSTINWAIDPNFIKTETDINGGATYTISGTSELMSVPYALFAANSAPGPQGLQGSQGIQGIKEDKFLSLFPNPNNGKMFLKGDFNKNDLIDINAINIMGDCCKIKYDFAENGLLELNFPDHITGLITLEITINGKSSFEKVSIIK